MRSPKAVTPQEAMAVWSSIKNPSARSVARALSQAGRRVHHSTIARWCVRGWVPVASGEHPIEAAREALDIAARLLTGDPGGGVELLERYVKGNERFSGLTEHELLRRATPLIFSSGNDPADFDSLPRPSVTSSPSIRSRNWPPPSSRNGDCNHL
jgi:hypothetical protein